MTQEEKRLKENKNYVKILQNGGVGIINTDTLPGIVGRALDKKAVERIYKIKGRNKTKPFIILISSLKDLEIFGINPDTKTKKILDNYWSIGNKNHKKPKKPHSIILPCPDKKFYYLHRGKKNLAFRLPAKKSLINLLKKTGPLVAPSANPEGEKPAENKKEALDYFENKVDFIVLPKSKKKNPKPSVLIKIEKDTIKILRK